LEGKFGGRFDATQGKFDQQVCKKKDSLKKIQESLVEEGPKDSLFLQSI